MTIKDTVKLALSGVRGNAWVSGAEIVLSAPKQTVNGSEMSMIIANDITDEQFKRALRDISYVQRRNGTYRVRGRRVPA